MLVPPDLSGNAEGVGRARRSGDPPGPCRSEHPGSVAAAPYGLAEFFDDQRRLVAGSRSDVAHPSDVVRLVDGRQRRVHARLLLGLTRSRNAVPPSFVVKYGPHLARGRWARFLAVVEYLDRWRQDIAACDLGSDGQPLSIREELVDYLLRCRPAGPGETIPPSALIAFLDEWGHRWM